MVKIVSFGLGGILIKEDNGWDMIRKKYKIPNLWESYMDGVLTRNEAKVGEYIIWKLQGVTKKGLQMDLKNFRPMKGAKQTVAALKKKRITPVIISDNPEFLVKAVAKKLGIRYMTYNKIIFDKKGYAYDTKPTHPSKNKRVSKLKALEDFAKKKKISLKECAVIGNGLSDTTIFKKSGLSIAFNATDIEIKKKADKSLYSNDLSDVLKFFK
ncbi:MAG: HAD-IB family phosphatase [Candidatus Aenigmarchaeota archaeon]|nr:HAD-IB family phosphatase [Candidatus Aenigmarchaeota archaeon]